MKDILGNEIVIGDIVSYACRVGTKQTMNFGIVVDDNKQFGHAKFRIVLRPLSSMNEAANIYRTKQASKSMTVTVSVNPSQVWAIKDTTSLPKKMVEVLREAHAVMIKQLDSFERRQEVYKNTTPGERYRKNMAGVVEDSLFAQMQNDAMTLH